MDRELPDWLEGYLTYTFNSEPPLMYHVWAGVSLVAGALQRKVYLEWGFETIYPNMYVVLVGPAGRARKGVALGIAKNLLVDIPGLSVAPEASTREAIINAMKRAIGNYEDPSSGKIKSHCSLTAFSEELSVFLGQNDIKFLANLTDWYDSKNTWSYETVGRGRDALEGLCFNLLGATAPEWLQSMLPQEAIGGGFTSRVIFIVEEKKGKTVPKHQLTVEEEELQLSLKRDLERISQLKGSFSFSYQGEKAYTDWYSEQDRLLAAGQPAVEDTRFAAYCERRATHLRKLMMVMSACRGDSLTIELEDFNRARETITRAEIKMGWTFGGMGKAKNSDATEKIMQYLRQVKVSTRQAMMSKFYRDVDSVTLRDVEQTLLDMRVINIEIITASGEKVYRWIGS